MHILRNELHLGAVLRGLLSAFTEHLSADCNSDVGCWQATRLIVTHMAKEPFVLFWWPMSLLLVCLSNQQLQFFDPVLLSWAAVGIALGGYLHYVFCVIDQICTFLGALFIPRY